MTSLFLSFPCTSSLGQGWGGLWLCFYLHAIVLHPFFLSRFVFSSPRFIFFIGMQHVALLLAVCMQNVISIRNICLSYVMCSRPDVMILNSFNDVDFYACMINRQYTFYMSILGPNLYNTNPWVLSSASFLSAHSYSSITLWRLWYIWGDTLGNSKWRKLCNT